MEGRGHSIWAMPTADADSRLDEDIARLARDHGTPPFSAHMTIAGSLPMEASVLVDRLCPVAAATAPFRIELGERGAGPEPFRSLYHRVASSAPLETLRAKTMAALALPQAPWMPHVSLLYGALTDTERTRLIDDGEATRAGGFSVTSLHVWSTTGPVSRWHEVAALPFVGL